MYGQPKVLVTRPIPEVGMDIISKACDVQILRCDTPPSREELLENVRGMNGLLTLLTDRIDAEIMDAAGPNLKIISNYAVGYDNIDVEAATKRGVMVGNTPGAMTETTADLAFSLLLAAARRIGEGIDYVRKGKWETFKPLELLGRDVHHAALGIIGMGRIGTEVAKRARGFDMNVLYYDHRMRRDKGRSTGAVMCDTLDDLLARSDFVSLHTPLNEKTRHLINTHTLGLMKKTAILINVARGPVVDTEALCEAIEAGRIAGAALDVTDPEPLPSNHRLLQMPQCIVLPHIGSATVETRNKMAVMAAENLVAGVTGGVPKYLVNCEKPAVGN